MRVTVDGNPDLERDMFNKAIISTDKTGADAYLLRKKMKKQEQDRLNSLETELVSIKGDITKIKELLLKIVENGSNS